MTGREVPLVTIHPGASFDVLSATQGAVIRIEPHIGWRAGADGLVLYVIEEEGDDDDEPAAADATLPHLCPEAGCDRRFRYLSSLRQHQRRRRDHADPPEPPDEPVLEALPIAADGTIGPSVRDVSPPPNPLAVARPAPPAHSPIGRHPFDPDRVRAHQAAAEGIPKL